MRPNVVATDRSQLNGFWVISKAWALLILQGAEVVEDKARGHVFSVLPFAFEAMGGVQSLLSLLDDDYCTSFTGRLELLGLAGLLQLSFSLLPTLQ